MSHRATREPAFQRSHDTKQTTTKRSTFHDVLHELLRFHSLHVVAAAFYSSRAIKTRKRRYLDSRLGQRRNLREPLACRHARVVCPLELFLQHLELLLRERGAVATELRGRVVAAAERQMVERGQHRRLSDRRRAAVLADRRRARRRVAAPVRLVVLVVVALTIVCMRRGRVWLMSVINEFARPPVQGSPRSLRMSSSSVVLLRSGAEARSAANRLAAVGVMPAQPKGPVCGGGTAPC